MNQRTKTVVEQLRETIRSSGKSAYVIAQGAGVDASVLSRFIRGERGINFATAAKVCAYMQLTLADGRAAKSARRSPRVPK